MIHNSFFLVHLQEMVVQAANDCVQRFLTASSDDDVSPNHFHAPSLHAELKTLPLDKLQPSILEHINANPLTLVLASTGSGKSTRIPIYLLFQYHRFQQTLRALAEKILSESSASSSASESDVASMMDRLRGEMSSQYLAHLNPAFAVLPHCRSWNFWQKERPLIIGLCSSAFITLLFCFLYCLVDFLKRITQLSSRTLQPPTSCQTLCANNAT
jgi:hypothetical protein